MPEHPTHLAGANARYFGIAAGRLAGGCACCALGFVAAYFAAGNRDVLALALVATIGGIVLGGWGLYATFTSERVVSRGVRLAFMFQLLTLAAVGSNLFVNHAAYSLPFIEPELLIVGFSLLAALLVAWLWSRFPGPQRKAAHVRRGRAVMIFAATALLLWGLLRYPVLAWYHIAEYVGADWPDHRKELLAMPDFVRRRAVNWAFTSDNYSNRQAALDVCRFKPAISADDLAEFCIHGGPGLHNAAVLALICADKERAVATLRKLVQTPEEYLTWEVWQSWMDICTTEDFDLLLRTKFRQIALMVAVHRHRGDLVIHSMKKPVGERVTLSELNSDDFFINTLNPTHRAQLYDALTPDDLPRFRFFILSPPSGQDLEKLRFITSSTLTSRAISEALILIHAGLADGDIAVVRAAYSKCLSCVENGEVLRARLGPLREGDGEGLRASARELQTLIDNAR